MMSKVKNIKRVILHNIAFQKTAIALGAWRPRHTLHDLDKIPLFLLGFDRKTVSTEHRAVSKHHLNCGSISCPLDAVIDWESARLTKPEKPLTDRETYIKYYPEQYRSIMPVLLDLGL